LKNIFFPKVYDWIHKKYKDNLDNFSYFEAGCGHGNDLRAIKKKMDNQGRYLGVDISKAEILHGIEFYRKKENTEESKKLFAQGDLRNLKDIYIWDKKRNDFSRPSKLKNNEFDLIYMEAVLHGLGHSQKTLKEKRESAQLMLNELYRICKVGGKFFGRANIFNNSINNKQQLEFLRKTNNWRFIPDFKELMKILKKAGFKNIKTNLSPHKKAKKYPDKKYLLKFSFLAEKAA